MKVSIFFTIASLVMLTLEATGESPSLLTVAAWSLTLGLSIGGIFMELRIGAERELAFLEGQAAMRNQWHDFVDQRLAQIEREVEQRVERARDAMRQQEEAIRRHEEGRAKTARPVINEKGEPA